MTTPANRRGCAWPINTITTYEGQTVRPWCVTTEEGEALVLLVVAVAPRAQTTLGALRELLARWLPAREQQRLPLSYAALPEQIIRVGEEDPA